MPNIYRIIEEAIGPEHAQYIWQNEESWLQVIFHSSIFQVEHISNVERETRMLLCALHIHRSTTIAAIAKEVIYTVPHTPHPRRRPRHHP